MPSFEALLVERDFGSYRDTVVYLPGELARELALQGRARCRGQLGKASFSGAWQPSHGRWFLLVSRRLLRQSGCAPGSWTLVTFTLTANDEVDVPRELQAALDASPGLRPKWQALTPGLQRSYAYRVASAKTPPVASAKTPATREKRAAEVAAWIQDEQARPRRGK